MCNLYSHTKGPKAIRDLAKAMGGLLIHTQHSDEDEMLIDRGYWGEGSVPPDLER